MQPTEPTTENNQMTAQSVKKKSSKKVLIIVALLVILAGSAGVMLVNRSNNNETAEKASTLVATPAVVSITQKSFTPAAVTVKVGETVKWTNNDTVNHQIAAGPHPADNTVEGFKNDAILQPGDSYSFTFDKAGTYSYHEESKPVEFNGTVIVEK